VGFCNWTRYKNTFDSYIHCKLGEITWHKYTLYSGFFFFTDSSA
jgi:hypothetical protein